MAEPASPRPPDNGDENHLDRAATPLRGASRPNIGPALFVFAVILVGGLWWALSGEEEFGPDGRPRSVTAQDPAVIPLPPAPPQQPPAAPPPPPPPPPPAPPMVVDPLAEERARLLLQRIRRLQKEMDDRRGSKMLVVSGRPSTAPGAVPSGAPAGQAAARTGAPSDNTPRDGNVGPAAEQQAVQARLIRTTGYMITEGTVIAGVLETAINSDLPGMVRGRQLA